MPLFKVNMPGNAQAFFNQIFKIAAFDIIEVEPYINKMLQLNATHPFNRNFESLGFQSMYFLNNLGPLLFAFIIYFLSIGFLLLLDQCISKSERAARWQGKLYDSLFYNSIVSIMMESYAIMACCVLINLHYIRWSSWGEIVQSTVCYFALAVLILFPLILIYASRLAWETNITQLKGKIEPFFEELDMRKGPIVIVHPIYFLLRRFLMAALVVYM